MNNVAFSTGSACHSSSDDANPVLAAIGLTKSQAREVMRFSFCRFNTEEEIDRVAELLERETRFLLEISPRGPHKPAAASRVAANKVNKR